MTAVAATGAVVSVPLVVGSAVGCGVAGVAAAYIKGRLSQIPDSLVDDVSADGIYDCTFCTEDRLREAVALTKPFYKHEYVGPDVAIQWLMKNRRGFVQIVNAEGDLCACFGILALSRSFTDQFIAGKLSDTQLSERDILPFPEARRCDRLYISGVVVRDPYSQRGHKRACVMLWVMLEYLRKVYGVRKTRQLYAVAVTDTSEKLMKKMDFKLLGARTKRVDKCHLYGFELTKDTHAGLLIKVGNYAPMCRCVFD